jgi:soluble lytic murein transglycosylase-like protein
MTEASQRAVRLWLGNDGTDVQNKLRGIVRSRGIPVSLYAGLIEVESGGRPEVISWAGAVGLGQVMPSDPVVDPAHFSWLSPEDARTTAANMTHDFRGLFAGRPTTEQLRVPCVNIAWGTIILRDNIARWGGDQDKALAAYLGGIDRAGNITDEGWTYVGLVRACQAHFTDLD